MGYSQVNLRILLKRLTNEVRYYVFCVEQLIVGTESHAVQYCAVQYSYEDRVTDGSN